MTVYQYRARNSNGGDETGILEAQDQDSAIISLQQKGLIVLSVTPQKAKATFGNKTYKVKLHSRVTSKDLILFVTQLATTIKANIPLLKCIEIQINQTTSRKLKIILEDIRNSIRQGRTLKDSMARHPKIFTNIWTTLIETGETSGQLPAILKQLTDYLVARNELRRKTLTAMIYPIALINVCIFAIYIFTIKVIPIFAGIFEDFDMDLPLLTQIVLDISNFLQNNILLTVLAVVATIYLLMWYIKTETGKRIFDAFLFKIPIFGGFILNSAIEKFSSTLGILLQSGIPILESLDIVARISGNKIIEEALKNAHTAVREGRSLSSSLEQSQIFPPLPVSMCTVGEETGQLDKMLEDVTKYYREELNVFVERLNATLEPLVIIIMGSIVFVLVLAMYLPIFEMALLH